MFDRIFGRPNWRSYSFIEYSTPYILTGLSVAFSFKTGVFNIGAEGQFVIGAVAAVLVGIFVPAPAVILIPLCIIAALLAGMAWGAIVGFLKEHGVDVRGKILGAKTPLKWSVYYLLIFTILLFGAYGTGYQPVDLIYAGF